MIIEQMIISPLIATQWLQNNTKNRPMDEKRVKQYASDITRNSWKKNGETIKLSEDGRLIDGQHRLAAIVRANKSIETFVVMGLEEEVFDTIDTGRARNKSDVLAISGYTHSVTLAATLALLDGYYSKALPKRFYPTNAEIVQLAEKYGEKAQRATQIGDNYKRKFRGMQGSVISAAYYIFNELNSDSTEEFLIKQVLQGLEVKPNSPAAILRNKLEANLHSKAKYNQIQILGFTIKAWNYFRQNKNMTSIKAIEDNSVFPKAI